MFRTNSARSSTSPGGSSLFAGGSSSTGRRASSPTSGTTQPMSIFDYDFMRYAFAAVAAGYLLRISPVATALAFSVVGAVAVEWLRARHHTAGDQALALVFY